MLLSSFALLSGKIKYSDLLYKLLFVLTALIWKAMLVHYYELFSKDFGYYGIIYAPRNWENILFSNVTIAIIAILIPVKIIKPSSLIITLLFLFCFIPIATVFTCNEHHPAVGFYGLCLSFFIIAFFQRINFLPSAQLSNYLKLETVNSILIGLFLISALSVSAYYGFAFKWVSFSDVYDTRAEYAGQSNKIIGYLYGWLSHVFNIAIMLFAWNKKKYGLFVFSLGAQVYLYTLGGHKSVLLIIPFVFWVWLGARYASRHLSLYLLLTLFAITAALFYGDYQNGQYSNASSLFIRRNLLLPAQIYFHFIEHFGNNYFDYFAQNFPFNLFYETKYNDKLPAIIGKTYFTFKEGIYANGNIFADMFANLGYASFIAGAIILSSIFKTLDVVTKDKNLLFVLPMSAVSIVTLSNSGLIVNLITHGILVMIILFRWYPKTLFYLRFNKAEKNTLV
jgi:hypothetical protein